MADKTNGQDWATETLKEAPFWREDMSPEEYEDERSYLHENWNRFMNGDYVPLWEQKRIKSSEDLSRPRALAAKRNAGL